MVISVGAFDVVGHSDPDRDVHGVDIQFGTGRLNGIGDYLDQHGLKRALVVSGPNVGGNSQLTGAIETALDGRLAGFFKGASQDKTLSSIYAGVEALRATGADTILGVGGGSSMVAARQIAAFAADGRPADVFREAAQSGELAPPVANSDPARVILLPTSLAGADIASAGITEVLPASESPTGKRIWTAGVVTPLLVLYDPELFATSPVSTLTVSAMNGFNKGIETIYAPHASPVSDAYSAHGLRFMAQGLPGLADGDFASISKAAAGTILVQLQRFPAIIHAFGHGISRHSDVPQGLVHAIVAPHVLQYVFDNADGRRRLIASALGISLAGRTHAQIGAAIVDIVTQVRDSLQVATRWAELPGAELLDWDDIGRNVAGDKLMGNSPVPITHSEATRILQAAA